MFLKVSKSQSKTSLYLKKWRTKFCQSVIVWIGVFVSINIGGVILFSLLSKGIISSTRPFHGVQS